MRLLRSLLFVVWLYGLMAVLGLVCLPTLLLPYRFTLSLIRVYTRLMLFGLRWICGIKVVLRGRDRIPAGPLIIAAKHQSMLDVFIPFLIFDKPVIVMKRELFWYPVLGWYAKKIRVLGIDRKAGTRAMRSMLRHAETEVLGAKRQLLIYPEGTRTRPGAPAQYKPAGIRAYYKALALPVLPLATNAGLCWPARGIVRSPGTIVYEVLPPIDAGLESKTLVERLERELEAACNTLLKDMPEDRALHSRAAA